MHVFVLQDVRTLKIIFKKIPLGENGEIVLFLGQISSKYYEILGIYYTLVNI